MVVKSRGIPPKMPETFSVGDVVLQLECGKFITMTKSPIFLEVHLHFFPSIKKMAHSKIQHYSLNNTYIYIYVHRQMLDINYTV